MLQPEVEADYHTAQPPQKKRTMHQYGREKLCHAKLTMATTSNLGPQSLEKKENNWANTVHGGVSDIR